MTAGKFVTVVVMTTVMMGVVRTEKCPKLDLILWDYPSCPYPESEDWNNLKLKMNCDGDHVYHCASNSQGCDVLLCVKRAYCEAGHRPLLDPDKDTAICAPCPPDRYQTVGFWSNERSYCEHRKTQCDGNGQIECQPGSTTTDRSCRCDIHQNLALQSYALHTATCCTNNDPWCECVNFQSPCPNGTVRHDNYRCLEECPPNSFRLWDSETCYPYSTTVKAEMITSTVKKTTEYDQMTTTSHQTSFSGSTGSPDTVNVGLLVLLIIVGILGLAGLMVGLVWVCHRMKKRKKGAPKDEEQAMSTQQQISGKGRSGKRTVSGHIDGSEPVDRANGHLAHVEVNSEVQEASSVSEEEATEKDHLLQSPGAETGPSTKGIGREDLRENEISNEGERVGDKSVEALLHPLQKEMTGSKVIVQNLYRDCVIISKDTNTSIHDGTGNTFNIGKKHRTKTTIHENPVTGNEDAPESLDVSHGASSLSTEENLVSMNPEESRHEESIMSDETSMDTVPKNPVEHEDIHLDETHVKNVPYPSQVEADDQTKRKEVWSPTEVVPDDQTKRKEVWSQPEVIPDDQTKRKEVWSLSVVADDQTKKKEPQIPGSDAEKRQKQQMLQSSDGSMSSREMEIFKPKVHKPDEQEESEDSSQEDVEETKVKEI